MDKSIKTRPYGWKNLLSLPATQDCLFLVLIVFLSVINYVPNLGFYSDDWSFLATLKSLKDQSLIGLVRSFLDGFWARPVQATYLAALYWLFGLQPIGYHLFNSTVLVSGIIFFYWVLRELNQNRWIALTVPMVYGLLPHYSTDRFWYAAFQANLSMVLYFLSLYFDLRMLRSRPKYLWGWKLLGLLALLGSSLAYEVFIPLLLLNPLLVLYRRRQLNNMSSVTQLSQRKLLILLGTNLLVLMLVVVFKKMVSERASGIHIISIGMLKHFIPASIAFNFGDYGLKLPQVIWKIVWNFQNGAIFALTVVFTLIVFVYLHRLANQSEIEFPKKNSMLKLLAFGLAVSTLGYGLFYGTKVSTAISNRVAIAAAVGVAFTSVGGLGWISNLLNSSYLRKRFFCLLIALLCSCGFLINNTIASFWIAAYRQQQEIIADIHQDIPTLPTGSTLILDGFCPYIGPGIVFQTNWDATGMLQLTYHNKYIKGDVVKPNLKIRNNGISLSLYETDSYYPYKQLYVYNFDRKMMHQLKDADSVRRYFAEFNPSYGSDCQSGKEDEGVKIF